LCCHQKSRGAALWSRLDEVIANIDYRWMAIEEYVGFVKFGDELFKVRGILAEFILDYEKNDPAFVKSPLVNSFRAGLLKVSEANAPEFLHVLNAEKMLPEKGHIAEMIDKAGDELIAFIDFDARNYVHSYFDLPLEDYLPKKWTGCLGDPIQPVRQWIDSRRPPNI